MAEKVRGARKSFGATWGATAGAAGLFGSRSRFGGFLLGAALLVAALFSVGSSSSAAGMPTEDGEVGEIGTSVFAIVGPGATGERPPGSATAATPVRERLNRKRASLDRRTRSADELVRRRTEALRATGCVRADRAVCRPARAG
ncbi:hypothetical protein [Rubrobacter radiotolerans]|uniref:Uncharacterized protein n=1 Tax=Rubrobacter radiotolerans TaxID=42256 RepID=A0AB35T9H5_RUBRA|nr:hypothetical protein [Rubrobacter radiotolerans]MDX5895610.1 hypothetical protein [Rubrobacter radiotolerans]SMC01423.1 conjugal transfer protein TrbL [Rubrobacter radiotolerans DSM 5868]